MYVGGGDARYGVYIPVLILRRLTDGPGYTIYIYHQLQPRK